VQRSLAQKAKMEIEVRDRMEHAKEDLDELEDNMHVKVGHELGVSCAKDVHLPRCMCLGHGCELRACLRWQSQQ
jgi:hypothetical protein